MGPRHRDPDGAWVLERRRGDAGELHEMTDLDGGRRVLVCEVTRPAWVLGSTQPETAVDHAAAGEAGVDVVRRRSGGGAVLLVPGEHVWVDVVLPAGDPLGDDDAERATWWLGEAWERTLAAMGVPSPQVHRRGVTDRDLGRLVCFAALGPGEVAAEGRKVVGVSQRRTRSWTRLQCVLHLRFDARTTASLAAPALEAPVVGALTPDASAVDTSAVDTQRRERLELVLRDEVGALERWSDLSGSEVVERLMAELGRSGTH